MTDSPDPRSPDPATAPAVTDDADLAPPETYDPADYRWVPVRRVPRFDGWTEEKQRRFIQALADTGLVSHAAKAVGMTREGAYQLRRSAHGAAFAAAWDVARHHAAGLIEDIVFDRAITGVEHEVYNDAGEVVGARLVHDNRLLKWLLSHLKPERYGSVRVAGDGGPPARTVEHVPTVEECLRAMEPALPVPPEELLPPDELEDALDLADQADGRLPHFLSEQRRPKTDAQIAADDHAARMARGEAAVAKRDAGQKLTDEEFADECYYYDPIGNGRRRRRAR